MEKDLFLIRHAESSHPRGVDDYDRPLNERGFAEAESAGKRLVNYGTVPQLLISSAAKRAFNTALIFSDQLGIPPQQVQPENMIYEASVSSLLSIVNHLPAEIKRVALFGHNPGISEFAGYLSGEYPDHIPTAGIIHLRFEGDWSMAATGTSHILWKSF
jgi:phosphohistidine phosphatase